MHCYRSARRSRPPRLASQLWGGFTIRDVGVVTDFPRSEGRSLFVSNLCKGFYKIWASCLGGRLAPKRGDKGTLGGKLAKSWPKSGSHDDLLANRVEHDFRRAMQSQFRHDAGPMGLHRGQAKIQDASHILICFSLGQQLESFPFALGE